MHRRAGDVVSWLLVLTLTLGLVRAHTVLLSQNTRDCYFEDLHREDQATITFQVASGGGEDIDFWVKDPSDRTLKMLNGVHSGSFSWTVEQDGRYVYCFSNEAGAGVSQADKYLSFNIHGIVYVPDDGHTNPLIKEVRALAEGLENVRDEHEYIVMRERVHRDTAETTNSRVKWWGIIQAIVLVLVCAVQILFVKKQFEVKRIV